MLNSSLRFILGLAIALACTSPAAAQNSPDPLTRFLDSIFKRPAAPPPAPAQPVEAPEARPAPAPQTAQPAAPRPKAAAPKKTAAPKVQPTPKQSEPEPVVAGNPEPVAEPKVRPVEPETAKAEPAPAPAPEPTIGELSAQAAEESKAQESKVQESNSQDSASEDSKAQEAKPEPKVKEAAAEPPKPDKPAPAPAPAAAPVPPRTPAGPPVPSTPAAALDRVNSYFNSIDRLSAYFVQKNPNGQQAEGTLTIQRPGRLHFAYAPPSTLEIVSDGRNVAIRDKRLGTNDVYPIGQTPLKFLLQDNVDLARDVKLRDVQVGRDGMVMVRFDDSATLGGTSKITLRFDSKANALRQWTIVDAQGYETSVTLSGLNVVHQKDARAAN